jgi:hypothetical protein
MSLYNLKFTKKSFKDFQKLKSEKFDNKARKLWTELKIIQDLSAVKNS